MAEEIKSSGSDREYEMCEMGVQIDGCMYKIRPSNHAECGSESVIWSKYGELKTDQRTLRSPFMLTIDAPFVVITADHGEN